MKITRLGFVSLIVIIGISLAAQYSHNRRMDINNWKFFKIDSKIPVSLHMTRNKIYKTISCSRHADKALFMKDSGYYDYVAFPSTGNDKNIYVFKFLDDTNAIEEIALDIEDPDVAYFEK